MKKRTFTLLVAILLVLACMPTSAFALAEERSSSDELTSETYSIGYTDNYFLKSTGLSGSASIQKVSTTSVKITATTKLTGSSRKINANVRLQWYKDGAWKDYSSASTTNSVTGNTVTATKTYTITRGYKYRAVGTHSSTGLTTKYSYSGSISL